MKFLIFTSIILLSSCSSNKPTTFTPQEEVVSRIDELSSRPSWLKESEPFKIEDGKVISLGSTQIPGDHRVEAAMRIAENNAKAAISSAIEQRLDFIFQNAEEGTAIDTTQARYIGAEASKLTTSSLKLNARYWEKVVSTNENGKASTSYRVFATVSMPETDFKQAIMEAIRRSQGKNGISKDFAAKVDAHWEQFAKAE
jgi:hypothetical protein